MKKIIILVTFAGLIFSGCGGNNPKKLKTGEVKVIANADLPDNLWTKLNGYWQYVVNESDSDDMQFVFYYFGYTDDRKAFCNTVWGYEGGEAEYVTEVSKSGEHRYKITFEVPANDEVDGLFEVHDAYSIMRDFDLTDYSNKKLTVESSGNISEWKYIGTEFPENLFEE